MFEQVVDGEGLWNIEHPPFATRSETVDTGGERRQYSSCCFRVEAKVRHHFLDLRDEIGEGRKRVGVPFLSFKALVCPIRDVPAPIFVDPQETFFENLRKGYPHPE